MTAPSLAAAVREALRLIECGMPDDAAERLRPLLAALTAEGEAPAPQPAPTTDWRAAYEQEHRRHSETLGILREFIGPDRDIREGLEALRSRPLPPEVEAAAEALRQELTAMREASPFRAVRESAQALLAALSSARSAAPAKMTEEVEAAAEKAVEDLGNVIYNIEVGERWEAEIQTREIRDRLDNALSSARGAKGGE